jgi:flagellar assembly factor FliW
MKIETEFFGSIEFDRQSIIHFPLGLPGFEQARRFVCVEQPALRPLVYLQSLEDPWLCLPTLPARIIEPSYSIEVAPDEALTLDWANEEDVPETDILCLAILNTGDPTGPTANLLSPVVVNVGKRIGLQVIQRHSQYDLRHPLPTPSQCEELCS